MTNIEFWKALNLEEKASVVGRVNQLEAFVHLTQYSTLKMIDLFIPEHVPNFKREEVKIEPVKFSSVSDNCVTKSLFIGSQYVGQRNK